MVKFDAPINADDLSFKRVVLEAPFPVLAVFWSAQDASRRRLNATLEQTARLYAGEILVVKLDIADSQRAQTKYSVHGVPQFLLFRDGAPVARVQGVPTVEMIRPWIEYLLGRAEKPSQIESATTEPPIRGEASLSPTEGSQAAPDDKEPPSPRARRKKKRKRRSKERAGAKKARGEPETKDSEQEPLKGTPVVVSDADFQSVVLATDGPALVFFWAPGVPACEKIWPTVKAIAWEFAGQAIVAQMDVEQNPDTPSRYGAETPPKIMLFSSGQPLELAADAKSARALRGKLRALVDR
jgi:thioredoxin 1